MTLLHLWSSRAPRGSGSLRAVEADSARRRSLSGTGGPARRQEKQPRDTAVSRWSSAKGINVCGSAFSPKPTPPRGRLRAKHNIKFRQISGSKDGGQGAAAPTTKTPPRKSLLIPELALSTNRQKKFPYVSPKQDSPGTTGKTDASSMPNTVREVIAGGGPSVGLRLLLTGGSSSLQETLPRSGSAPSPLAVVTSNSADVEPTLPDQRDKLGCSPSEPEGNLARTSRSCWDEKTDATLAPADAATTPPNGSTSTGGNKAKSTVSEEKSIEEPLRQQPGPNNGSTRSSGCPISGPLLPLLLPEQQVSGKGAKSRRQRLEPLRRRQSETGGGGSCRRVGKGSSSDDNKAVSAGSESTLAKRRSSAPGLKPPDKPRPSTSDSTNTANEEAAKGLLADQGHLKARLRVMEWKRRRAEEMKTQQEEQASAEQVRQAEADTEAARKLAATRAEEAERRLVAEREKTASAIRATEAAEKWAKVTRQREQRRAKVYAINAIMRAAFENEFKAFSLEQEKRAARSAAPAPEDPASTKHETPPQQQ